MASQVRITHHSLPSFHDHIGSCSSFDSKEGKVPDTFSAILIDAQPGLLLRGG